MRHFGNKKRTRAEMRTAAISLLALRRTLDGLTAADVSRTTGVPEPEAAQLLEEARKRRAA
jgi:hypothetical protein